MLESLQTVQYLGPKVHVEAMLAGVRVGRVRGVVVRAAEQQAGEAGVAQPGEPASQTHGRV